MDVVVIVVYFPGCGGGQQCRNICVSIVGGNLLTKVGSFTGNPGSISKLDVAPGVFGVCEWAISITIRSPANRRNHAETSGSQSLWVIYWPKWGRSRGIR